MLGPATTTGLQPRVPFPAHGRLYLSNKAGEIAAYDVRRPRALSRLPPVSPAPGAPPPPRPPPQQEDKESAKKLAGDVLPQTPGPDDTQLAGWTTVARVLLNLNATISNQSDRTDPPVHPFRLTAIIPEVATWFEKLAVILNGGLGGFAS